MPKPADDRPVPVTTVLGRNLMSMGAGGTILDQQPMSESPNP